MPEVFRILHLLFPAHVGGLETVVATLATGQARAGMRVMVATLVDRDEHDWAWRARLEDRGVLVRPLVIRGRRYLSERKAVGELLSSWNPQVLHTHGYRPDVVDAPVARRKGIPTVTTVHGFTGTDVKNRFYEWLQRRSFRDFDAVVAVSGALEAELKRAGVREGRIHRVQNAWAPASVPLSREEARAELGLSGAGPVVGWVGRFTPEKAPDLMVRAFSLLRERSAVLVMVGDGWMCEATKELACERGLGDRVMWPGILPEAFRVFKAFDLLALTSRTEGTPVVLLEAMAAEVPIVSTPVGGVPEMLSEREAVLVRSGEDRTVAEALDSVLSEPDAAKARAGRARCRFERDFAVAPWVKRYLEIYRAVMQ